MPFKSILLFIVIMFCHSSPLQAIDRNGLIAFYPFTGDAKDYSGNNFHATAVGATLTTDRAGNPNSAYFFNGNDIVRSPQFHGFSWGDQFTVSAWYKRTGLFDKYMGIVNNGYFDKGSFEIRMGRENGGTNIFGRINSEGGITNALGFNAVNAANNQWHHSVLTYDGNITSFYIDGQLITTSTVASGDLLTKFNILAIGMGGNGGGRGVTGEYFYGSIDDVRIYQKAVTSADVLTMYQEEADAGFIIDAGENQVQMAGELVNLDASNSYDSEDNPISYSWETLRSPDNVSVVISDNLTATPSFTTTTPGFYQFRVTGSNTEITLTDTVDVHIIPPVNTTELIAYYPIASNALDYSGNNRHGVVSGAQLTTDKDGNPNSAYFFDGRDKITVNSLRNYAFGNQFSASVWYRRTGQTNRYQGLLNNGYNTFGSFEIRMGRESNGRVIFSRIRTDSGATPGLGFNDVFPTVGQWHHAVVTYDGQFTKFYINGVLIEQSGNAQGELLIRNTPLTIGHGGVGASNTEFFFGAIDDIRIYNKALSYEEIEQLYLGETSVNDADGDGIEDTQDNCPSNNNANQLDLDMDGIGDACDDDIDGDSFANASDNCPTTSNIDQSNLDGDNQGDACDTDIDGDTFVNTSDNCPLDSNVSQSDLDGDSIGDACDDDLDGDSLDNDTDNCPTISNLGQEDLDEDNIGDACDTDLDGDTVDNSFDNCPIIANPQQSDWDLDGIGDACDSDKDNDGWVSPQDCDEFNDQINPDAIEILNNGIDENCNGNQDDTLSGQIEIIGLTIEEIINANPGTHLADKLQDALDKLAVVIEEFNKSPPDLQAALGNIEGAIGEIEVVIEDGLLDNQSATFLTDGILNVARQVAIDAINLATNQNGDGDKIQEAQDYLLEADDLRLEGKLKDAAAKYKDALATAEGSI